MNTMFVCVLVLALAAMVSANGRGMASCLHRQRGYKLGDLEPCPYYRVCQTRWTSRRVRCRHKGDCMNEFYQRCLPKAVNKRLEGC
ncbi:hypothetical protein NP493_1467g00028 [Ridgeia piscesae]|uniref:Secreted protein n=1 Tax=Ridgeia piscesae TaxID=27915 RepID=A0AAD9NAY7_RIDPI|nr:hypothetical protein NP493_1467g00028 [Ridgeia piscesae]